MEKVCVPKSEGGLGIRNSYAWNLAAICKLSWKKQPVVHWEHTVWNSWSVPKHMFINWLITREALLLKDTLFQLGVSPDALVVRVVCSETHAHLFSQCVYTRRLMQLLSSKLKISLPAVNVLGWISSKPWAKVKKWVTTAWIHAVFYTVWIQRNCARLNGCVMHPDVAIQHISSILKFRTMYWLKCTKRVGDETWIKSIQI
ncbi:uncharacterized protein LOC141641475 [Silene latifolia]|uniref:uncharacterized protein LOC141641475 n=1 Tax=Silene latifolia TaxID=37657 RepID=UPI003D76E9CE